MTLFKYSMKKAIKYILILLSIVIMLLTSNINIIKANALSGVTEYTDVLDDLQTDDDFSVNNYNIDETNYGFELIQIYETELNNLILYVFQPSHYSLDCIATSINISNTYGSNEISGYENYKLKLLSTNGCFDKYIVCDYTIPTSNERYYFISAIYRAFNPNIDKEVSDNTITEISYVVGHQWKVTTIDSKNVYEYKFLDVIDITYKHLGFIRYRESPKGLLGSNGESGTDRHYMAFDIDRKIDDLIEVEMKYDIKSDGDMYGDPEYETKSEVIKNDQVGSTDRIYTFLWFSKDPYTWDRIQTKEEFEKTLDDAECEVVDDFNKWIEPAKWVINITETSYITDQEGWWTDSGMYVDSMNHRSLVENVQVFRMKFIVDGVTYDLAVADDIQSGDEFADGKVEDKTFEEWFEKILMLVGIMILVVILGYLAPVFSVVFKVLVKCIEWAFKGLLMVISAPFKLIGSLFKTKKRKR